MPQNQYTWTYWRLQRIYHGYFFIFSSSFLISAVKTWGGGTDREQNLVLVNVSFSLGVGWSKGMASGHKDKLVVFVCCYKMREDDNLIYKSSSIVVKLQIVWWFFNLKPLGKHKLIYVFKNNN